MSKLDAFKAMKEKFASGQATKSVKDAVRKDTFKDERLWQYVPKNRDTDVGRAKIRFLPSPDTESPFVTWREFGFKGEATGKWYFERSLSSLKKTDPVEEYSKALYKAGNKAQAAKYRSREQFLCNIYVIDDPVNPENNGKVMLWKFGRSIYNLIDKAINPKFEDDPTINPFDLWNGATFEIRTSKDTNRMRTYDDSRFDATGPLFDNDEKLKEVFEKCYPLMPENDESKYKPFNELKDKFNMVMGFDDATANQPATAAEHLAARMARGQQQASAQATQSNSASNVGADVSGYEDLLGDD